MKTLKVMLNGVDFGWESGVREQAQLHQRTESYSEFFDTVL